MNTIENASWFFSDSAAVQRLCKELESWRGTPFRFGSRAKGIVGGTDCVGFCEAVMKAAGAVEEFNFPRRPADMSRHVHNDRILNYLRGKSLSETGGLDPQSKVLAERFEELDVEAIVAPITSLQLMPGDLLILKTGVGLYHMPIMMSHTAFMQCAYPDGVSEGDITAPNYREHLVAAFRARAEPHTTATKDHKVQ